MAEKLITTVSTKGQVILPSAIRKRKDFGVRARACWSKTLRMEYF